MQAAYTSIILAILCTASVCAIGLQSPKTTGRNSKNKVRQSLSNGTKCGISATAPNGVGIVGGEEAKPHSWPWQVFIQCSGNSDGHFCGGSIISDKWVITAAHCLYPANTDIRRNCKLLFGKHDLQRKESTQVNATIAEYFVHEKYVPNEYQNAYDLALCKLAKPVKFTDAIQPICLPFGLPELPYNTNCYATGWGSTRSIFDNPAKSDRLMQLSMTVTDEKYCEYPIGRIICTARWDGGKDVCFGDSGGPLACQEQDRKWYLQGVLTETTVMCDLLAISTNVTSFEIWIKNITSRRPN